MFSQKKKAKQVEHESPSRVGAPRKPRQEEQHPCTAQQLTRNLHSPKERDEADHAHHIVSVCSLFPIRRHQY